MLLMAGIVVQSERTAFFRSERCQPICTTCKQERTSAKPKALLHSLVPRAQCFCFYDVQRECVWSSDGADDYEIDNFRHGPAQRGDRKDLDIDGEVLRRTLNSGRTLLVLPVHGDEHARLGILVAVFSRNAGKSASFNPSLIANILTPAVDVIGESLLLATKTAYLPKHKITMSRKS